MSELTISSERLTAFAAHLRAEERSPGTIENYPVSYTHLTLPTT